MTHDVRCAHCSRPAIQPILSGTIYGEPRGHYCHPDWGLDCYSLVTVAGHSVPCEWCHLVRLEQDAIRRKQEDLMA